MENNKEKIINFIENNACKENIKIKNNFNIDFTQQKLRIDIIILIFFYGNKGERYYFQEKIFQHFKNLEKIFKNYIDFSYTIVGSENELSKDISLKYFKEDEYFEFHQDTTIKFWDMLFSKVNYSLNQSYKKDVDIHLWVGSNDYICINYFKQIIEQYNNQHQMYGISNYNNGENLCYYIKYDKYKFIDDDKYLHDGVHNYCNRQKYKFIGGTVGITHKTLDLYPNILEKWHYDEGKNETIILNNNNQLKINDINYIHIFKSYKCFFINTKFLNDNEITSFDTLKKLNKNNIIEYKKIEETSRKIIEKEFNYFDKLKKDYIYSNINIIKQSSNINNAEILNDNLICEIKKFKDTDLNYNEFIIDKNNNTKKDTKYLEDINNKNINLEFYILSFEINFINFQLNEKQDIINIIKNKIKHNNINHKDINQIKYSIKNQIKYNNINKKNIINNSISTIQEKKDFITSNQKIYNDKKNKLKIKDKLIFEKLNKLKELYRKNKN